MTWEDEFRRRMERFGTSFPIKGDGVPASIKVRVSGGCFHREHSPNAYQIIDEYLRSHPQNDCAFEEHESGPELLVYLAFATAGISLTANIINLVTTIIKARTEGIEHGDHPNAPLELIVRGFDESGKLREERVLRVESWHDVSEELIERSLLNSINKMAPKSKGKKRGVIKK
jgi:hypothetical protein